MPRRVVIRTVRWLALVAAAILLGLSVTAVGGGPAGADGSFRGVAAASGLRVTMKVANAPATDTPFDAGGPVAQAVLDSLGTRDAYAASPYPGELVVLGPGLAAGFWGQTPFAGYAPPPSIPPYPWFVSASAQQPEARNSQGLSTLEATSAEGRTHGRAVSGTASPQGSVGSAVADSEVARQAGGEVVATGTGDVQSFAAGPLKIGSVYSRAVVTRLADGTLQRESSLEVKGATIADVGVEITPKGIKTPGGEVPTGGDQFSQILKQAGLSVTYVNREDTSDGVVGAGLRITQSFDAPRFGVGAITYAIGQASASVGGALDSPPALPVDSGTVPADGGSGPSGSPSRAGAPGTSGSPAVSGVSGLSPADGADRQGRGAVAPGSLNAATGFGSASPSPGAALPTGGSAPAASPAAASPGGGVLTAAQPASLPGARSFGVKGSYLVGVVAALVLAALAQLTSVLGVRGRWT